jgi:hypothetical protein
LSLDSLAFLLQTVHYGRSPFQPAFESELGDLVFVVSVAGGDEARQFGHQERRNPVLFHCQTAEEVLTETVILNSMAIFVNIFTDWFLSNFQVHVFFNQIQTVSTDHCFLIIRFYFLVELVRFILILFDELQLVHLFFVLSSSYLNIIARRIFIVEIDDSCQDYLFSVCYVLLLLRILGNSKRGRPLQRETRNFAGFLCHRDLFVSSLRLVGFRRSENVLVWEVLFGFRRQPAIVICLASWNGNCDFTFVLFCLSQVKGVSRGVAH